MIIPKLLLVVLSLVVIREAPVRSAPAAEPAQVTFESLFGRGTFLEDLNGDGIVDFVNVRIVVPAAASTSEIVAAAEMSARLGYETTATDLSFVIADADIDPAATSQPLILIGQANKWISALVAQKKVDVGRLVPGQGAAVLVRSAFGSNDALILIGADDGGTAAVGKAVASRLPFVGTIGGARFATVESDLEKILAEQQIHPVSVPRTIQVVADSSWETPLVSVEVPLRVEKDLRAAERVLQAVVAGGRQGPHQNTLRYPGLRRLEIQLSAAALRRSIVIEGPPSLGNIVVVPPARAATKPLDLAQLYSVDGLFEDTNNDMIPDTSAAALVLGHGSARPGVAALAARLGLESAGIRLPLTRQGLSADQIPRTVYPILIEDKGSMIEGVLQGRRLRAESLNSGDGLIQIVPRAVGETTGILVTGSDQTGIDAALEYAADRLPHLSERGKDRPTLGDVSEEARTFFAGRSRAGQAAMAVYKLDRMIAGLKGKSLDRFEAKVFIDEAPPEFKSFLEQRLRSQLGSVDVDLSVASLNIHAAIPIFEENVSLRWEVDDFWKIFREQVLPRVKKGSQTRLELRVSESPEIRQQLAKQIGAELDQKSGKTGSSTVTVLSAHKAGFTWLTEVVESAIRGKDIGRILVRFAELKPVNKWQLLYSRIRWLQEIFPVDEILARDLEIPLSAIEFDMKPEESPTYEVVVTDKQGTELYRGQLDGKLVTRPYFDQFSDYDTVHVSTGWVTATVDGARVANERVVTDLEKFWDHYQKVTLPRVYTYIMDLYEGKPRARYAPYFGELRIDLTASEANYRLGIDEEIFSPMDALSEDIYFNTLTFFDTMGLRLVGEKLWHPGRILPYLRPSEKGAPAKLQVRFTGKPAGHPQVVVRVQERGGRPIERKEEIAPVNVEMPRVAAVVVRHGAPGLERILLEAKVNTVRDEREALLRANSKEDVDALVLSQQQAVAMVNALAELQGVGLYTDAFGHSGLRNLEFIFQTAGTEAVASLRSTGRKTLKDIRSLAQGYRYQGEPIVQWDTPISPEEGEQIIAKLATFPEFTGYHAGRSLLGRDIWALDVMLPMKASHWSQAKLSTVKPALIINARQHGNETSGTSHVLRLAELIATRPEYKRYLDRVNIAILPITNPDGAAFAGELAKITPDFILHAGYFGALGVDMTAQQWDSDPIYPEAKVRPKMWRTWLPDLFLDPHGSPKHEWLQIFAGYPAWVTSRLGLLQDWQIARGWWTSVRWVEGAKYPYHKDVALALRDYVIDGVSSLPEVIATSKRMDSRFDRYGGRFEPEIFKSEYYRGVRIHEELRGLDPDAPRGRNRLTDLNQPQDFAERYPNVTVRFGHRTESPDETAWGDWLKLFASAGLQFDLASVKYLYESRYEVKRTHEREENSVRLATIRPRPPLPGARAGTTRHP